jgi:hypothetical protein
MLGSLESKIAGVSFSESDCSTLMEYILSSETKEICAKCGMEKVIMEIKVVFFVFVVILKEENRIRLGMCGFTVLYAMFSGI